MTTRNRLADALDDIAAGYTAEGVGITPDPLLGRRIHIFANRIRERLRYGDPRLAAFTAHTDPTGYVWLPQAAHGYLTDESAGRLGFDRWMTGLAQAAAEADPPTAQELEELAADAAQMAALCRSGMHLSEARREPSADVYLFRR